MKKITITFASEPGGWTKATVYEDTNRYLFTCHGPSEASALHAAGNMLADYVEPRPIDGVARSMEVRGY
jgi:hypothetical protein